MKFGMGLNFQGETAERAVLVRLARLADEAKLDTIWAGDHVVFPPDMRDATYPYTDNTTYFQDPEDGSIESITAMSYLAALVDGPRVGFSVLIVPYRNPVLATKMLTTLDLLSEGRLIVGVGAGWLEGEFEALGADYANRGAVTDEYLEIYRTLCAEDEPSFKGKHYSFDTLSFFPKPFQKPWPPIWVGGNSKAALRRAARFGSGWHPLGLGPDAIPQMRGDLERECEAVGRDPSEIELSLRVWFHIGDKSERPSGPIGDGTLMGSVGEISEMIERYEEAGVKHILFKPLQLRPVSQYEEQLHQLIEEIVPLHQG